MTVLFFSSFFSYLLFFSFLFKQQVLSRRNLDHMGIFHDIGNR